MYVIITSRDILIQWYWVSVLYMQKIFFEINLFYIPRYVKNINRYTFVLNTEISSFFIFWNIWQITAIPSWHLNGNLLLFTLMLRKIIMWNKINYDRLIDSCLNNVKSLNVWTMLSLFYKPSNEWTFYFYLICVIDTSYCQ